VVRRERVFLRRTKRQKFGELLLTNGSISPEQLEEALQAQQQGGGLLGDILLEKGFITETEIVRALSTQYGLPVLRGKDYEINKDVIERYPVDFLYSNLLLPFDKIGDLILVLVCDLPGDEAIAVLEKDEFEVVFYVSSQNDIQAALAQYVPVTDEERRQYLSMRRKRFPAKAIPEGARGVRPAESAALTEAASYEASGVPAERTALGNSRALTEAAGLEDSDALAESAAVLSESGSLTESAALTSATGSADTDLLAELDKSWETIFDAAEQNLKKEVPPKKKG
jgi:hypothetical protein